MRATIVIIKITVMLCFVPRRDKCARGCNADILIEQDKDDNPHKRKFVDNNNEYLA